MAIHVLIVDDHSVVREGLRTLLRRDPELKVVDEAANGMEAVEKARLLRPDIVLMDLLLPGMDGIVATSTIRRELPDTEVLILTAMLDSISVAGAIRAGAIGYLLKDTQAAELRSAIKGAAAGQVQLSSQASSYLLRELQSTCHTEPLTGRETDVLHLLAQGCSNKEIAHTLHIVEDTVKTHIRHIFTKLGVQNRSQAILTALRLGLVSPSTPSYP